VEGAAIGMKRVIGNNVNAESAMMFVADTVVKTRVSARVIHVELKIAKNIVSEVKEAYYLISN